MLRVLVGIFVVLHGLVHLWYFTLGRGLVEFQPEMGWTGKSWILSSLFEDSTIRSLASVLFVLATIAFVISGIGIFFRAEWWRPVIIASAVFSSAIIILFWDGNRQLLVQKGLVGLLINLVILAALLVFGWPSAEL
jgi:hypothetical protein